MTLLRPCKSRHSLSSTIGETRDLLDTARVNFSLATGEGGGVGYIVIQTDEFAILSSCGASRKWDV